MTPLELLITLRDRGVLLTPNVTTVRVDAPSEALTGALRAAIQEHKAALLALVEDFEERAALTEYCGDLPRAEAEARAWACVLGKEEAWIQTSTT